MTPEGREDALDTSREGLHHVGNSTHWIVLEGVAILTDPWLSEPADGVLAHRYPPRPLPTRPDVVLISHEHGDHYDATALDRLDRGADVVVPEGEMAEGARALGFGRVHGVRAGDVLPDVRGLAIEVVRGRHSVPEVCFRVERRGRAFFFGGDTMVTAEIEELAAARPVPFAILPGERSRLLFRRYVMTPEEAVGLARRLGARRAVLTHHEQVVARRWPFGWMVHIPPVGQNDFPDWFVVPRPGDYVAFPWADDASKEARP
ncbi:MAG TPA: MBL fold metallo-hydrolase [Vicinamibacteria bacterium]|nr:MBL fold metallo-hydrolase [Vicinamibacteria bacterium]